MLMTPSCTLLSQPSSTCSYLDLQIILSRRVVKEVKELEEELLEVVLVLVLELEDVGQVSGLDVGQL